MKGILLLCLSLCTFSTFAQVTVNLQVTPPYSPFFRDYQGYDISKVFVTLFSATNRQVYLTGSLTSSNGAIQITANPNFKPSTPVQLLANQLRTLNGTQLNTIFGQSTQNDLVVTGLDMDEIILNQALPEGVYTMCVEAKDYQTGQVLGISCRTLNIFYFEPPQIIQPICGNSIKETKPQNVMVSWNMVSPGVSNLSYKLKICKQIPGVSPLDGLNNNIQVILDRPNIRTTFFQLGDISGIKLEPGESYSMQVTAYSPNAFFKNGGVSEMCTFTYQQDGSLVNTTNPNVDLFGLNPDQSSVSGKLIYRYKEPNDQPKTSNFNVSQIITSNLKTKRASMPAVVGSQRFDTGSGTSPIKNTKIYLVYDLVKCSKANPTSWNDFEEIYKPSTNGFSEYYYEESIGYFNEKNEIFDNKIIAETTTSNDGTFSFPPFVNDLKLGYLGSQSVGYLAGSNSDDGAWYLNKDFKSEESAYIYGVLHIVIDGQSYYCNPDLMLFPKPGQGIALQPEVCFVDSRNVKVGVRTDPKIQDQIVNPGIALTSYPVQLGRENNVTKPTSFPIEADESSLTKLTAQSKNNHPLRILSTGKTDGNGFYLVKNICNSKTPLIIQATDPGYDATKVYQFLELSHPTNKESLIATHEYNPSKCNTKFQAKTETVMMDLKPKNPEIYLRAVAKQNGQTVGIADATIEITTRYANNFYPFKSVYKTDQNGYFHLPNLYVSYDQNGKITGPRRTIVLKKAGYNDTIVCSNKELRLGERFPANPEVIMNGSVRVNGFVRNEKGEAVSCHVRVGDGPFIKNSSFKGYFSIPNCPSGFQKIEVVPDVDNYFAESFTNLLAPNSSNNVGIITVKEKLHRVIFKLVDEDNQPITEKMVFINVNNGMKIGVTNSNTGLTNEIAFASPASEFHVKTALSGYVPFDDYVIIPISKYPKTITLTLAEGQTIQGFVFDDATNQPIAGARVYVVTGTNDDGEIQRETTTNSEGRYYLPNVPVPGYSLHSSYTYDYLTKKKTVSKTYKSNKLQVFAVKSGNPSYIQGSNTYTTGESKSIDFRLTKINGDATIWGNPVEITKVQQNKIWGSFVNMRANENFAPLLSNAKLPFNALVLNQTALNQGKIVPESNEIVTEATSLKIKIYNDFEGEILGTNELRSVSKLKIEGNSSTNSGDLKGFVVSSLASFDFSYNYTGGFLLQVPAGVRIPGKSIPGPKAISVLAMHGSSSINQAKYALLPFGSGNFKVHNFNASLGNKSYVQNGAFYLSADVKLNIPLTDNQTLDVGDIKITKDSILWLDGQNPVDINLEKWKIQGSGLRYDLNKGGFIVLNNKLVTHLPSLNLKEVVLRPIGIDMESNSLSNVSMNLAGVTPLNLYENAQVSLTFDQAAPFDKNPHWRLNISQMNDGPVAYLNNIPGLDATDRIKFGLISAYSDGEHQTTNLIPEWHNYFNVIQQKVVGIELGRNYFTLIGDTDLKIPGAGSAITGRFKYMKRGNNIVSSVESLNTDIEMPGKVQFNGGQKEVDIYLRKDTLLVKGELFVYQNSKTDGFKVKSTLLKTPQLTSMTMKPGEFISLEKNKDTINGLNVLSGFSSVSGNHWANIQMTTKIMGFGNIAISGSDILDFEIKGAIENSSISNREVKLDGIDTPFGGLKICFDFKEKLMKGSLTIPSFALVPVGPVSFSDGTIDLQIGGGGFIFAGAFRNVSFTPISFLGGLQASIAMGHFSGPIPSFMQKNLLKNTLYAELPSSLTTSGLSGFYCNVGKLYEKSIGAESLIPESVAKYFPSLKFAVGFDVRTILNIKANPKFEISALAKANVNLSMEVLECEVGVSGFAQGSSTFGYGDSGLTGQAELSGGIEPKFCGSLGSEGLSVTATYVNKKLDLNFSKN